MTATMSDRARAFLSEPRFAVLGTSQPDGSPHLTVMWYDLDGDEILMNTAAGRIKDSNLRRDARISICVEDGYDYVTVSGTARLIEDREVGLADIIRLAHRYHPPEKAEQMGRDLFSKQHRITIRMQIEHVVEHW
jgi:PPOX class probable F420-dependent enzyme